MDNLPFVTYGFQLTLRIISVPTGQMGKTEWKMFVWITPGTGAHYLCSYYISQNLITWQYLTTREKCLAVYSRRKSDTDTVNSLYPWTSLPNARLIYPTAYSTSCTSNRYFKLNMSKTEFFICALPFLLTFLFLAHITFNLSTNPVDSTFKTTKI